MGIEDILEATSELMDMNKKSNEICYYTGVDTFYDIIKEFESSNDNIHINLWATDAHKSNDKKELSLGFHFILDTFKTIENDIGVNINNEYRLSSILEDIKKSNKYNTFTEKDVIDWLLGGEATPYILCFTRHIDQTAMWNRTYGRAGKGVCLVFDRKALSYIPKIRGLNLNGPLDVIYGNRIGYSETKKQIILMCCCEYQNYRSEIKDSHILDEIIECKLRSIEQVCSTASCFIKDETWHDEREVRIAAIRNNDSKEGSPHIKMYNERSYVELKIPISCLSNVIVGPCVKGVERQNIISNANKLGLKRSQILDSSSSLQ